MRANRNITRIDRKTTGGFLVRVVRRRKLYSNFFADHEHGGKRKSLAAARQYRDELEAKLKPISAKKLAQLTRSNNTSGIPGVRLVTETDARWASKPTYSFWVAQWSPKEGGRKSKRFSVNKYGNEEAKRLAIAARKRGVRSMAD